MELGLGFDLELGLGLGLEISLELGLEVGLGPLHNVGDPDGGVHALGGLEDGALGGLDETGLKIDVLLGDHVQDLDDLPDLDEPGLEPNVLLGDHVQDLAYLPDLDEPGLEHDVFLGNNEGDLDEEEFVHGSRAGLDEGAVVLEEGQGEASCWRKDWSLG